MDAIAHILASFDADVDDEGYIVDEITGERIETPEGYDITVDELALIEDGSTQFVDDNFSSLVEHTERRR